MVLPSTVMLVCVTSGVLPTLAWKWGLENPPAMTVGGAVARPLPASSLQGMDQLLQTDPTALPSKPVEGLMLQAGKECPSSSLPIPLPGPQFSPYSGLVHQVLSLAVILHV
jgi:hypothetical protein